MFFRRVSINNVFLKNSRQSYAIFPVQFKNNKLLIFQLRAENSTAPASTAAASPARPGAPLSPPPPLAAGALKFACDFLPGPALSRAARCRAVTNSGTTLSRDKIAPGLFTRSMGVRYKRAPGTAAPARRAVPPRAAACPCAPPPAGASAQPATGEASSLLPPRSSALS